MTAVMGVGLMVVGCSTAYRFDPEAQNDSQEMTQDDARALFEKTVAQSFDVKNGIHSVEKIEFSTQQIDLKFRGNKGVSDRSCSIPLLTDQKVLGIDLGNDTRFARFTERRYTASFDEQKALCGMGWAKTDDATNAAKSIYALKLQGVRKKTVVDEKAVVDFNSLMKSEKERRTKLQGKSQELNEEGHKHALLAKTASDEKRYTDAIDHYEQALKTNPAWLDGRLERAKLLAGQAIYAEAIAEMRRYQALLDPAAMKEDAKKQRDSQDLIYIWEDRLGREMKKAAEKKAKEEELKKQQEKSSANAPQNG